MQDEKPGRAQDPVEEAAAQSFPASDPPAWTATRAGEPEQPADKEARRAAELAARRDCEAAGFFRSDSEAQRAADALLGCGFNSVDIGPPRARGNLAGGVGERTLSANASSLGLCAALGALAAGAVAALLLPRGMRHVLAAAAGGAVGAASVYVAQATRNSAAAPGWPPNGVLVRVRFKTTDEQQRALSILEAQGAAKLHVGWAREKGL
jgi:hypothetical protein